MGGKWRLFTSYATSRFVMFWICCVDPNRKQRLFGAPGVPRGITTREYEFVNLFLIKSNKIFA